MITLNSQQTTYMARADRTTHLIVQIGVDTGYNTTVTSWQDMTALRGWNWVDSVRIEDSMTNPTRTATVTFKRRIFNLNLTPTLTTSALNGTLDLQKQIRILVATTPPNVTPESLDWIALFTGRINHIAGDMDTITCDCRDYGGDLMDVNSPNDFTISGSPTPITIESAIQTRILNILFSGGFAPAVTLVTPVSPGTTYTTNFTINAQPALAAIQTLAKQIGWQCKYRWNLADFSLTLYNSGSGSPSWTFGSGDYFESMGFTFDAVNVRNIIYIQYSGGTAGPFTDATSVSKYGQKILVVGTQYTSGMTLAQCNNLGAAMLLDQATADLSMQATMPFFYPVEAGDLYTFNANGVQFDTNQNFYVTKYTHEYTASKATTTMELSTKPVGASSRYQEIIFQIFRAQIQLQTKDYTLTGF